MDETRRGLLAKAGIAVAGVVAAASRQVHAKAKAEESPKKPAKKPAKKKRKMIGACGLACKTCPLMKAKKCKGCASGKEATPEILKMKPCPVLKCAAMKKIDYCGTGCKMFTQCKKLIGKPYDKTFIAMIYLIAASPRRYLQIHLKRRRAIFRTSVVPLWMFAIRTPSRLKPP